MQLGEFNHQTLDANLDMGHTGSNTGNRYKAIVAVVASGFLALRTFFSAFLLLQEVKVINLQIWEWVIFHGSWSWTRNDKAQQYLKWRWYWDAWHHRFIDAMIKHAKNEKKIMILLDHRKSCMDHEVAWILPCSAIWSCKICWTDRLSTTAKKSRHINITILLHMHMLTINRGASCINVSVAGWLDVRYQSNHTDYVYSTDAWSG